MGRNPYPYGLEANRRTLGTFLQYNLEQGLLSRAPTVESLFPPAVYDETD